MSFAKRKLTLSKLIVIGLVIGASALTARAAGLFGPVVVEEATGARREIRSDMPIERPDISFIDSPSATCQRSMPGTGQCTIQWTYLNVSASTSQYVISMTVEIDGRLRAYHSGFFQASMYIPGDMYGDGFRVTCGKPDANGWGNTYAYTLRARETGGLSAANYGSVTCPGDMVSVFLPTVMRR
jgi:hypothetical protein